MSEADSLGDVPVAARVVHKSAVADHGDGWRLYKLMLNVPFGERRFEAGSDVAIQCESGLRRFTVESVGDVPFEDTQDLTLFVRATDKDGAASAARRLSDARPGESLELFGPFTYPFYPPIGSRSNMILIGAGGGMVPLRWLARRVQARSFDWMGKVLMLEGPKTGLEHLYQNDPADDQGHYFDHTTYRAFEALKTRYSATASDRGESAIANREAMWRLLGQGSVYVYVAGYRSVAAALDRAMQQHLRLDERWQDRKAALIENGHWLEYLYD